MFRVVVLLGAINAAPLSNFIVIPTHRAFLIGSEGARTSKKKDTLRNVREVRAYSPLGGGGSVAAS